MFFRMPSELTTALSYLRSPHNSIADLDFGRYTLREILVTIAELVPAKQRVPVLSRILQAVGGPGVPVSPHEWKHSVFSYVEEEGSVRFDLAGRFWAQIMGRRFIKFNFEISETGVAVSAYCDDGAIPLDDPLAAALEPYMSRLRLDLLTCAQENLSVASCIQQILDGNSIRVWTPSPVQAMIA